jgi:hypothetical protein
VNEDSVSYGHALGLVNGIPHYSSFRPLQETAGLWALDNPTVSQRLQSYAALVEDQMLRRVWEAAGGAEADFPLSDTQSAVLALVRSLRSAKEG